MKKVKMDPSLAEVRKWRETLQEELAPLGPAAELEEIHRRAQDLMKSHGIELKTEKPRSRQNIAS